jgi:hypothetical protein
MLYRNSVKASFRTIDADRNQNGIIRRERKIQRFRKIKGKLYYEYGTTTALIFPYNIQALPQ